MPYKKWNKPKLKNCKGCGENYAVYNPAQQLEQQYCSRECFWKHRAPAKPRRGVYKDCEVCEKEFYVSASGVARRFCSQKCMGKKRNKQKWLTCKVCGDSYSRARSQIKHRGSSFCSNKCKYKNMGKKPSTSLLDTIWSQLIKERAGGACEYCGKKKRLNAHHIFSRSNFTTRWDPDNGVSLCPSHHLLGIFSAHKAPLEFGEWIKEERGEEWYDNLRKKARKVIRAKDQDRLAIKEDLKERLAELRGQS